MNKWDTKAEFIAWVQDAKDKAVQNSTWGSENRIDIANSSVMMDAFNIVDDEVLDLLNEYYDTYEPEIIYLQDFCLSLEEYRFFQRSGVRERTDKFNEDISKLKIQADKIRSLSLEPFTIRLPKNPKEIVHGFVTRWRDFGIQEEAIDEFCKVFGYKTIEINRKIPSELKLFKENDMKNRPRYKSVESSPDIATAIDKLNYYTP